ncbi:MAG: winged helix-turn-helix transcriptional regulator [Candidatus Altiarchaeota archaeon]|nr:winged helix-turn-helix transcriptional regulator [Candidatus Altiarchaeota archaeon]
MKIDELDLEIIKYLQENARMSFREIGKNLGVPHTTIFTRAERLIDKGVIKKFAAILHPHELGLQTGYVILEAAPSESKRIAADIAKHNEARKIYRTFDGKILVNFMVPEKDYHQGMEDFLSKLEGCPMKTYPIHDIIKYENTLHPDILKDIARKK